MTTIIEIGTAKAKPGTIEEGKIIVEKLAGGGEIAIPVTIINGQNDGYTFKELIKSFFHSRFKNVFFV